MFTIALLVILAVVVIVSLIMFFVFLIKDKDKEYRASETSRLKISGYVGMIAFLVMAAFALFSSYKQVEAGNGGVVLTLGKVELSQPALVEGPHWLKPWQSMVQMSAQQISYDRNKAGDNAVEALAGDDVTLNMDASFFWLLSYDAMPYIYQKYGASYWDKLQIPSIASTFRDVIKSKEEWEDVNKEKQEVEISVTKLLKVAVNEKLAAANLPENIIKGAFTYPKMELRRITPPPAITDEIGLKKAAVQKNARKETEIKNAALDAQKRGMDGTAIRQIILRIFNKEDIDGKIPEDAELPANLSAKDISGILDSVARKQMADAAETAAEKGNINSLVIMSGETSPAAVPAK